MPERLLEYFVEVLKILDYEKAKYTSVAIQILTPIFIVLYNGKVEVSDKRILNLSDLIRWKGSIDISIDLKVWHPPTPFPPPDKTTHPPYISLEKHHTLA